MSIIYDRKAFFGAVRRTVFHVLSESQVAGCESILSEAEARNLSPEQTAYILATAFWETGRRMQPVREAGEGRGRPYGLRDAATGQIYYGRGLVQLTWKANYEKFAKLCNADLTGDPDLALRLDIAVKIAFEGMIHGVFTGRKLDDYINTADSDFTGARRIVNGQDQAQTIARFAKQFERALVPVTVVISNTPSLTAPAADARPGWWTRLKSFAGY